MLPAPLASSPAFTPAGLPVPAIIARAGDRASRRFVEFFTASIRNRNTREAYARAVADFLAWCEPYGLELASIEPVHVAAYVESCPGSVATVKQRLAAIRALFDYLVTGQALPFNPALSVRGPKLSRDVGATPVLTPEQARALLNCPDVATLGGLRDRAMIGLMLYSFARVSAVVGLRVRDHYPEGTQWRMRLMEKGGKVRVLPVHHEAEAYLAAWIDTAGIGAERDSPLFRALDAGRRITARGVTRSAAYQMIRYHAVRAGIEGVPIGCHSMRGTGITTYLENGGQLETAQGIAGHASIKTTRLYDRRASRVQQSEIERVRF